MKGLVEFCKSVWKVDHTYFSPVLSMTFPNSSRFKESSFHVVSYPNSIGKNHTTLQCWRLGFISKNVTEDAKIPQSLGDHVRNFKLYIKHCVQSRERDTTNVSIDGLSAYIKLLTQMWELLPNGITYENNTLFVVESILSYFPAGRPVLDGYARTLSAGTGALIAFVWATCVERDFTG